MNDTSQVERSELTRWYRMLRFPLVRIAVALLAIAIPFAIVAAPFNMFVSDKSLKRAGAILLTVVVVAAYWGYVRLVEKRAVSEFSGHHAIREMGAGLSLGALLFSMTIGVLAALGAYQVTGNNGWPVMLAHTRIHSVWRTRRSRRARNHFPDIRTIAGKLDRNCDFGGRFWDAASSESRRNGLERGRGQCRGRHLARGGFYVDSSALALHRHPYCVELHAGRNLLRRRIGWVDHRSAAGAIGGAQLADGRHIRRGGIGRRVGCLCSRRHPAVDCGR
jgi:hypothetical protein